MAGLYREDSPGEEERYRNDVRARQEDAIKEYLLSQLQREKYTGRQREIMDYLIDCLDEKGYFTYSLTELASPSGYEEVELAECLEILKDLEPIGIFSKDLAECLERQLRARGEDDEKLFCLLREYLTELMNGQIGVVSRKLGISTVQVKEYIHLIGNLNPRPIMSIQREEANYIIPDIIVSRHGGMWDVSINDSWMGEYKFSSYYIRMMEQSQDPELLAYFKERLERARFVINCVEQRRRTITRIVETVLNLQEDYFEGKGPLRPMQQEDVANLLGIHVSTVSRAIKGKYVQYKKPVALKSLFSTALPATASVSASVGPKEEKPGVSVDQIKQRIQQMIEKEGKKPLSDQKLMERLSEEGIQVSRRAVQKYRIQLNIPDSRQRGMLL